jgi:preprotein translocase subunit SecE
MGEIRHEREGRRAERRAQADARRAARPQQPRAAAPEPGRSSFIRESYAELKKVEWPGQAQVIQGTVVVIVACVVVGLFLYVNDQIWKQVVEKVFLR